VGRWASYVENHWSRQWGQLSTAVCRICLAILWPNLGNLLPSVWVITYKTTNVTKMRKIFASTPRPPPAVKTSIAISIFCVSPWCVTILHVRCSQQGVYMDSREGFKIWNNALRNLCTALKASLSNGFPCQMFLVEKSLCILPKNRNLKCS